PPRCRARQQQDQAVNLAPGAPIAGRNVTATGPERRALSGSAPPASGAPEDRFKPLRRNDHRHPPLSAGDLCRPSGLTARAGPDARPGTRGDETSSMFLGLAPTGPGSTVVGGPAGHADHVQYQYPREGLVLVLRVAPCQPGGKPRRPASGGAALPAQLGSHPPQP